MSLPFHVPSVVSLTPFADTALFLQTLGLAVIPLGGEDGKEALKRNYPKWKRRPGQRTVAEWSQIHPTANIGVLCLLSKIAVADVDDASQFQPMLSRFGDTPLIIRTRRGYQLWYRARGDEEPADLRISEGLAVEIKAGPAAIVVVPPSWNRATGHPYVFEQGSWADLERLPLFRDAKATHRDIETSLRSLRPNPVGTRNTSLFDHLRKNFSFASLEETEAEALWYNQVHQAEPEPISKVIATARSVWAYMSKHERVLAGQLYIQLTHAELDALRSTGHLYPQTLALIVELKRQHGGRVSRGELFAICAHRISEERLIPGLIRRKRIEQVRRAAEEIGLLIKMRDADRNYGQFRAARYTFGRIISTEEVLPLVGKSRKR